MNVKNAGRRVCVVGIASVSKKTRTNGGGEEEEKRKKYVLAKGVDVIKTTATNCSFVLCTAFTASRAMGVNFGRVFFRSH